MKKVILSLLVGSVCLLSCSKPDTNSFDSTSMIASDNYYSESDSLVLDEEVINTDLEILDVDQIDELDNSEIQSKGCEVKRVRTIWSRTNDPCNSKGTKKYEIMYRMVYYTTPQNCPRKLVRTSRKRCR